MESLYIVNQHFEPVPSIPEITIRPKSYTTHYKNRSSDVSFITDHKGPRTFDVEFILNQ